jgi:hypothetical protein
MSASLASQILKDLLLRPWYRRLVTSFSSLAALESEFTFLSSLKAEVDQGLVEEQAQAQKRAAERASDAQRKAAEASGTRFDGQIVERRSSLGRSLNPQAPPGAI